jgi:hypothetical protein
MPRLIGTKACTLFFALAVCVALRRRLCSFFGWCPKTSDAAPHRSSIDLQALDPSALLETFEQAQAMSGSGFRQPGYTIWGGSVIHGDDGLFHKFVSRWDERLGHNAWVTSSEVAHAVADSPLGPWTFRGIALPRRGVRWWDGMATHNPSIHWHPFRKEYLLFYIGTSFEFAPPHGTRFTNRSQYESAWNAKRIGVAISPSLEGPWARLDSPILSPRAGQWDGGITSNPAAALYPNGSVLLLYKSIAVGYPERNTMKPKPVFFIGGAFASDPLGPYHRLTDTPLLRVNDIPLPAEDPYVWRCAATGRLHLIFKTMQPVRTAPPEKHLVVPAGWLAYSYTQQVDDLSSWAEPRLAFNRTVAVRDAAEAHSSERTWSGRRRTPKRRAYRAESAEALLGLPALLTQRHARRLQRKAHRKGQAAGICFGGNVPRDDGTFACPAIAAADGYLKVDRLERPQLLMSADGSHPTHLFAAMMINGSSANAALSLLG